MGLFNTLLVLVLIISVLVFILIQWGKRSRVRGTMPIVMNEVKLVANEIPSLKGKVAIVTGANIGLGKSTVMHLAKSDATVIMACRSYEKALKAKTEIVKKIGRRDYSGSNIDIKVLDLGSLRSVREFVQDFRQDYVRLDMLILNAGIAMTPFRLTEDGIESQIGVNHFGHFYLTELLTPMLINSQPASIVSVSSISNFDAPEEGVKLTLDELNDTKSYVTNKAYGQSKLANILFVKELSRRMTAENQRVYVNAVHPGAVATELIRHLPKAIRNFVKFIVNNFPNTIIFEPDYAAMTQVYVAVAPVALQAKFTGRYFVPIGEITEPNKLANDTNLQQKFWEFSETVLREKGFDSRI